MEKRKHILLCVAGGTPAIITETLWALKERGERVDEIGQRDFAFAVRTSCQKEIQVIEPEKKAVSLKEIGSI
ncbi:MAG: hypothetical protein AUG51_08795 [Acidobacteria bacterium 13_1_20CM_3_53_8]|nr:MAG: hypothetical protein AUG51_08795 [Acidobacteria bacterium 13_1_20CM_3_53_8]